MAAEQPPAASWGADTDGRLNQPSEHLTHHAMWQTDDSGNVTGLVGPDGASIMYSQRQRKGRQFGGAYGRRMTLWSDAALQNSDGTAELLTTDDLPPRKDSATKVLKLTQNATASFGQAVVATADYTSPSASVEGAGIWVKNPGSASLSCQLLFYNAAGSKTTSWNFTVDPCDWTFITLAPISNIVGGGFTWGTDAMHFVRVSARDAGGDAWPTGAICYFGPVYVGTRGRARFMLCNDDGLNTVLNPANYTSGWPASGKTYREIIEYYGFKGTLYIVPPLIGTAGYLNAAELLTLQDEGWAVGSHSYTHPAYSNRGLTSLGPVGYADAGDTYHAVATNDDTAIYSDVMRGIEALGDLGIRNPDHLFAIPQGTWDAYVRSAVMRSGVKHVRGISSYNNYNTLAIGRPSGGGNSGSSKNPGGWIHQADAVQSDGALTSANLTAYVDNLIAYGATGANYHHGVGTGNADELDALCAYLKTKSDAGLIEVVTAEQVAWDDGLI